MPDQTLLFIFQTELLNWMAPVHTMITALWNMNGHVTLRVLRLVLVFASFTSFSRFALHVKNNDSNEAICQVSSLYQNIYLEGRWHLDFKLIINFFQMRITNNEKEKKKHCIKLDYSKS